MLVAADMLSIAETAFRCASWREMPTTCSRMTAAGRGVIVSDNLAQLQHLHARRDRRAHRAGRRHSAADRRNHRRLLRSAGVDPDRSSALPAILAGRLGQLLSACISRRRRAVADVRRRILERYAGQRQVFVLNNDELKNYVLRITDQWFGLTYRADRGRRARRHPRDREHADGVDYRPAARARRAARPRRQEAASPAHDLDGGASNRRASASRSASRSARSICTTCWRSSGTMSLACSSIISFRRWSRSLSRRRFLERRFWPRSGRPKPRCADRSWRRSNMSNRRKVPPPFPSRRSRLC